MNVYQIGLLIVTIFIAISGQTKISGKIQDTLFSADQSPFLITDNVIVPAGKKLVIEKGCVFLFKPFTSISVEGTLIVSGTPGNQVVFTSEYETRFNRTSSQFPNPFDWNGILITQNADSVYMSNFTVAYSVYGIKSYNADIVIENGVFSSNGQSNLSLNEVMINVADGVPYSYRKESPVTFNLKSMGDESQKNYSTSQLSSGKIKKEKEPITWNRFAKIGCISGSSLSFAATLYFYLNAVVNQNRYFQSGEVESMNIYKARRNSSLTFSKISAIPTVLFAGGAATFFIVEKRNSKNKKVTMVPCFGDCNGFELTLRF